MDFWLEKFVKQELREYNVTLVKLGDSFFPTASQFLKLPNSRSILYDFDFYRASVLDAEYKEKIWDTTGGASTVSCLFSGTDEILGNVELIAVYFTNEKNDGEAILCVQ